MNNAVGDAAPFDIVRPTAKKRGAGFPTPKLLRAAASTTHPRCALR